MGKIVRKSLWMLLALLLVSGCGTQTPPATPNGPETDPEQEDVQAQQPPQTQESQQEGNTLKISVGGYELLATFEENASAEAFIELLSQGPLTVEMADYGGFEKVGPLGTTLTRSDTQITTQPGDVILYQGSQITIYYGTNTWNFTRLARIDDPSGLGEKLGAGTVSVTFSLA